VCYCKGKALSAKANMVEDKPSPKRYEKKPDHKKKYKNKFSRPNGIDSYRLAVKLNMIPV